MGWTREQVEENLLTDWQWVRRGLYALWNLQTKEEQEGKHPDTHNGVGFSRWDGDKALNYITLLNTGCELSLYQIKNVRKLVTKYAGQLTRIANKEI